MKHFNIVIVGCGGTGSWLIDPLMRYLNSLERYDGSIVLCDGDSYSAGNVHRQSFDTDAIGVNKAVHHAELLKARYAHLNINYVDEYLSAESMDAFDDHTIFINCTDNHAARKIIEDYVDSLRNSYHICCGNEMTRGQVQISGKNNGWRTMPSIYSKYPEFNTLNGDRSKMSCEELGQLPSGGQVITANFMAASIALNYTVALIQGTDPYVCQEVGFNTATNGITSLYE